MVQFFSEFENWSPTEHNIYDSMWSESMGNQEGFRDQYAEILFHEAFFNQDVSHAMRVDFRESLKDYIYDEYGYDFDEVFDWDAWREAYGTAA